MADHDAARSDVRDLLAAYAFDAVDDLERRAVERLLEVDADARRELDEYREVVAAFTADTAPPASLRDQVLTCVETAAAAPPVVARRTHRPARPLRRRVAAFALAAAAVAAVAVPATIAVQANSAQQELQAQADAVAQMLADPSARIVTASVAGGGEMSALVSSGRALVSATGMADAGQDQDYQLWTISGETISSAGVLDLRDGNVSTLVDAAEGTTLAVTVEPSGGSEQPTSDPIVAVET